MPKTGKIIKFEDCLTRIPEALEWAEKQDVEILRSFFPRNPISLYTASEVVVHPIPWSMQLCYTRAIKAWQKLKYLMQH